MTLLLLSLLLGADPTPSQTWPGFRGDGSSTSTAKELPLKWSPSENRAWVTPVPGYGQSSPVVWGDRAFVTAIDGAEKEKLFVVAVDVKTGKADWKKEFAAGQKGKNTPMMSRAAPTPVVDADRVYAFFESGDVVVLTHAGDVKWERSLSKDYGAFENGHGIGSSPAQTDKAVVILIDDRGPSYLVALDKETGKNLWKADRKSRGSWTSPVIGKFDGKPAVLVSSSGSLDAYDAASGKVLATLDGLVGNNIPSPTVCGGLVLVGAGENRMKPDSAASAKSNCCVRLKEGEKPAFEVAWEGKKAICQHASPLAHQGHAYFVTKVGLVVCLDLKTGEEKYAERLGCECWATPVGAGDHVYFFGKDGVTTVLKAGPKYERVATNRLWSAEDFAKRQEEARKKAEETLPKAREGKGPGGPPLPKEEREAMRYSAVGDVVYGVAAVDGAFIVRTGTELYCVRETKAEK